MHIETMTANDLRTFMSNHNENEYLLVDVREPEEYEVEHIPGAKLVPLMDLELGMAKLDPAENTIFYCRSGNRSMRGAQVTAARRLGASKIYNLMGGINAYQGRKLSDVPNLKVFNSSETLTGLLLRAMDLEKAADRLYAALGEHLAGTPVADLVKRLEEAEEGHARAIHSMLKKAMDGPVPPFEQLYEGLEGLILESGEPLVKLVAWITSAQADQAAILEVALDLELKAYDLYRNLAHQAYDPEMERGFIALATQEQQHARIVARAIGKLAKASA